MPVTIVEADDRQTAELAIVENLQRKDLNALEKAASFQRYLDQYGCTQEELAGRLKLDRSTIANLIRLLELPEPVQEALRRGKITPGPRPGPAAVGRRARAGRLLRADPEGGAERAADRVDGAGGDRSKRIERRWGLWDATEKHPGEAGRNSDHIASLGAGASARPWAPG